MGTQKGGKRIDFRATINGPEQIRDAVTLTNKGIGLIRTENLVYADEEQMKLMRKILIDPQPSKSDLNEFYTKHLSSMQSLFFRVMNELVRKEKSVHSKNFKRYHLENALRDIPQIYPITVRLMDAPVEEILSCDVLKKMDSTPAKWRGINMGHRKPTLYFKHMKAVFRAYGNMLNSIGTQAYWPKELKDKFKLNVLIPNVTSASNVHFVKMLTDHIQANVSHRFGFDLGAMIENKQAVKNVEDIAENVSFISIGSNDLSAEVLGVTRSELLNLKARGKSTYAVTLHPLVKETIINLASRARKANPTIHISLCGAHAQDLKSLRDLRPAKLDAISLPPSPRNHIALYADWGLYNARKRKHWPAPKNPTRKSEVREEIDLISDLPTPI